MSVRRPGTITVTMRAIVLAVALVAAVPVASGSHAAGSVTAIRVAGTVSAPASRGVPLEPRSRCDLDVVRALAQRRPHVGQWIVVDSTEATASAGELEIAIRTGDDQWVCQRRARPAMLGRSGTRPLADRRSGDGTTPAGVFPLGTATAWDGEEFDFFGNDPDPGVRGRYREVRVGDCWGANPGESTYNHLYRNTGCSRGDDEYLPAITGAYSHAALIGANGEPDVSGDGPGETPYAAAIFLHRHAYVGSVPKATSGCVSLELEDLVATLRLIDPQRDPHFAIGPRDWLLTEA